MKIAGIIRAGQNDAEMLRRALDRIIQLYTDKAHFVYELLQNAEDSGASNIKFEQFADRLEVLHDGRPFTEENLKSLCDIGKSDKEDDLNQIGEFGVGFKSVFGICEVVRLYSAPSHYKGNLTEQANPFAVEIHDFIRPHDIDEIELDNEYTTKFVFPFHVGETYSGFTDLTTLRTTLTNKLKGLDVTTLLFMKNLKEIHYKIYGASATSGTYLLDTRKISDKCMLVSAIGENAHSGNTLGKEDYISYLKFSRQLPNSPRTVDIAFAVKNEGNNKFTCIKSNSPFVSVYFPTGTESKVDFIVQGPFRTTPDRSSIPPADPDNRLFASELAILLKDSLEELKRLKILNISFIRCLPINKNRFDYAPLLYPLYAETENTLKYGKFLPANNGTYISAVEAKLTDSKQIAVIFTDEFLTELINDRQKYFWLPTDITDSNSEYRELYSYLTSVLRIGVIRPESLRVMFNDNEAFIYNMDNDWLISLYEFFMTIRAQFNRDGKASLVFSKIVKTAKGKFEAPYRLSGDRKLLRNIFLPSKKSVWQDIEFVDETLYKRCKQFFDELLDLREPDEYQFFVEYVKSTYGEGNLPETTHADDIKFFVKYMNHPEYGGDMLSLMNDCLLLKCRNAKGKTSVNPYNTPVFFAEAQDGIQIETYYQNVFDNYYVDTDYYTDNGISIDTLALFNIHSSIILGDERKSGYDDYMYWQSHGEFCPLFDLDSVKDILKYISENPKAKDSMLKSKIILDILKKNENKLSGTLYISGKNIEDEFCTIVKCLRGDISSDWNGKWLYTNDLELVSQKGISKRALSSDIYGAVDHDSDLYTILGFKKTEEDEIELAEKEYNKLPPEKRRAYFEIELRRQFGMTADELVYNLKHGPQKESGNFDDLYKFPEYKIRNWVTLRKHTTEIFAAAEPVKYEKVVRTIRTSRTDTSKDYLLDMYQYDGTRKYACQMCHEPIHTNVNGVQIFTTPELELDPIHLCLCSKCMDDYHSMQRDDDLMESLRNELLNLHSTFIEQNNPVIIKINDKELWFTQMHIAEIHELLVLMKDVKDCENSLKDKKESCEAPPINPEVVATFNHTIFAKYAAMVGKKIKYKSKRECFDGVVESLDNNGDLWILIETGHNKGEKRRYSINTLESKDFIQVIED